MTSSASGWSNLRKPIRDLLSKRGMYGVLDEAEAYLEEAYDFTESLWTRELEKISSIRLVLLSEAPLYGVEKSYIYNPTTPITAFFHFNDLQALIPSICSETLPTSVKAKKLLMIEHLRECGVVVLDVFPYALNKGSTHIGYRQLKKSEYVDLLVRSIPDFLEQKLTAIKEKQELSPTFAYRYRKLEKDTGEFVAAAINRASFDCRREDISVIGGTNMSLDRGKLAEAYGRAT